MSQYGRTIETPCPAQRSILRPEKVRLGYTRKEVVVRPGTLHAPGLPTELVRIINSSVKSLNTRPKDRPEETANKVRAPKRKGGRARKEQD